MKKNSFKEFLDALDEIQKTKGIDKEEIVCAVEAALISAYKKDHKSNQNVKVSIDRESGEMTVCAVKEVVEVCEDSHLQISLAEAKEINESLQIGDEVDIPLNPKDFGRVAAQNARQLITQRIKEAERNIVFDSFSTKKDEIITGIVQRDEQDGVLVNLDRIESGVVQQNAILTPQNQIKGEEYYAGVRIKVYVVDVVRTTKGPQIIISRTHPGLVKRLFEFEIPEIYDGTVEIKSIAREAGSRTKIAVYTKDPDLDPVGTCVGQRGMRIQNIINEIGNERIDVIKWNEDPVTYISNALSPAEVLKVDINEEEKMALVVVDDSQLSLAIGKDGQNVRLAARLTGWKIDIKNESTYEQMDKEEMLQSIPEATEDDATEPSEEE